MKKLIALAILGGLLTGCAKDNSFGQAYGFANAEAKKNPAAIYEWSAGSVIMAIIFSETIVVPVYVVGWNLFEATGVKK